MNAKATMIIILTLGQMLVVSGDVSAQILERVEVKNYEVRWNDAGSGAKSDIALWHPKAPSGYFVFGSIGLDSNKAKPDSKVITYAYKPNLKIKVGNKEMDAIVYPKDYKLLWKDKGTGAKQDGSIWEPIAPAGYVALGCVAVSGYDKPSVKDSACILNDTVLIELNPIKQTRYMWYSKGVDKASYNIFKPGTTFRAGPDKVCIFTLPAKTSSHLMFVLADYPQGSSLDIKGKLPDMKDSALRK